MLRLRTDQLMLYPTGGGAPRVLFTESRPPGDLATQDVFQVSPDGGYVAYAAYGSLHVRAADGSERTIAGYGSYAQMRFSPDGQYLAATVRGEHVVVFELATGATRDLGELWSIRQLEWIRGGLVLVAGDQLVELPLAGERAVLLDHGVERFAAAGAGTRVVAFVREPSGMRIVDAAAPAHDLGRIEDTVTNAAASLDGTRVAFTTSTALFTITGDGHPQAIAEPYVHSVWFARDGRLGYASASGATFVDAAGTQRFVTGEPITMLRFDTLSAQALVATGDRLGLDHFAGGYIIWTAAPDVR